MMRILLLEDDRVLSQSLQEYLQAEGFEVDVAYEGEEAFEKTFKRHYDLYVFDVNLPDVNGFDVLSELKAAGDETPTIYITARSDVGSIAKGFNIGAEDYIKKPFDPQELVIRIKMRYMKEPEGIPLAPDIYYDIQHKKLYRNGTHIVLGGVQGELLHMLVSEIDNVVPSERLMTCLDHPNLNALRVNIAKLKQKSGVPIKNIRAEGYMVEKLRT